MTRLYLFIGLLYGLTFFVSCRKEINSSTENTTISPPEEIAGPVFQGVVRDGNALISGAQVDIYQNEKLVGSIFSDAAGAFSTNGIPLVFGKDVTFHTKKSNYVSMGKRIKADQPNPAPVKIKLTSTSQAFFQTPELTNPGSNDLIMISGYATSPNGVPILATVCLLYDRVDRPDGSAKFKGDVTTTDEEGYYEMLLPKNQVFDYLVLQGLITPNMRLCGFKILNSQDVLFIVPWFSELVGPFDNNTQLPTLSNGLEIGTLITFSGKITSCDGQEINNGRATITFTDGAFTFNAEVSLEANGSFTYKKELCSASLTNVSIEGIDLINNKKTDKIILNTVINDVNIGNVPACQ